MKKLNFLTIDQNGKITETQKQNDCDIIMIGHLSHALRYIENGNKITLEGN